jgi:peptide/nickel transport system permease protein
VAAAGPSAEAGDWHGDAPSDPERFRGRCARIVRSSTLTVKTREYVQAARVLGAREGRIVFRHIFPNCLSPLIVQLVFVFAYAIVAEAALSFIGVGTPPPTPSLGNILSEGRNYLAVAPWTTIAPGVAISITVLSLNLAGDGLRDILDPKMKLG